MVSSSIGFVSSFLLGALHSLEPGHGKSILALNTSKSLNPYQGIWMLVSILVSHFSLVIAVALVFMFLPNFGHLNYIKIFASILIICYGLFLVLKKSKNNDFVACSCSHEDKNLDTKSKKEAISLGILAGLTPCPSVFAPIFISMGTNSFSHVLFFIISYMLGVISVFLALFFLVWIFRNKMQQIFKKVSHTINPHIISGAIMIGIGVFYLLMNHSH